MEFNRREFIAISTAMSLSVAQGETYKPKDEYEFFKMCGAEYLQMSGGPYTNVVIPEDYSICYSDFMIEKGWHLHADGEVQTFPWHSNLTGVWWSKPWAECYWGNLSLS